MTPAPLEELEAQLGYRFAERALLERALTHASCCEAGVESNERLEFLGDAVLGFIIGHVLFEGQPDQAEGDLTRLRAAVVSARSLGQAAEGLALDRHLRLGKGMRREGLSRSVLSDAVEAVLGAVFLDGGLSACRAVALRVLDETLRDALARRSARNWKSALQEHTQHLRKLTPTYRVVTEAGPDHAKEFEVAALVEGEEKGRGRGASKKAAEQAAARQALLALEAAGWGAEPVEEGAGHSAP